MIYSKTNLNIFLNRITGPILINLEEDMSFLHTISENPNVQFGGRAIPQLCKALQKIAIIIPYRNREPHLKTWLHYMHPFLQKQQGEYGVYVVEQVTFIFA